MVHTHTQRRWEISDIDGSNKRTVTLAQYRAELDAAKAKAAAIYARNVISIGQELDLPQCEHAPSKLLLQQHANAPLQDNEV